MGHRLGLRRQGVKTSEVKSGLRHPREAMVYLLMGRRRYSAYHQNQAGDTCNLTRGVALPFSSHMSNGSDIHEHLTTLFMLTVELRLRTVVELGVRTGESTVALLFAAKEIGGRVFSYDIDRCEEARRAVKGYGLEGYWTFRRCDDLSAEWSSPIGHLFIDTSHTYDQTARELERYGPLVRAGGIITMHDSVSSPGVRKAALDYTRGKPEIRLYEYLNNNGLLVLFKK